MSRERVGYTSPHHEGAWSNTKNYTPLSVVTNNGSSYIAKKAVPAGTALNNSVYWGLLASVGSDPNITITKTGTSGLVDTYTWTDSTSGNTGTFTVTNGQDGDVTADVIATPYDNTVAYKVGILLTYLGKQYYCIADATAGTLPTNTTYFEEKSVADIIEMIKNGSIKTGHSQVSDNWTPYSEDSGTTQENPFISQGTGTDNNSVIVTTGKIARQLEKQGNTVVKNQLLPTNAIPSYAGSSGITFTNNGDGTYTIDGTATGNTSTSFYVVSSVVNHQYFIRGDYLQIATASGTNIKSNAGADGTVYTATVDGLSVRLRVPSGTTVDNQKVFPIIVDITSYPASVITDLTTNPSHFSWYYNGSLAYDAGSLQNCNGRYLECGQGRQLWDEEVEQGSYNTTTGEKKTGSNYRSKNYILVVPKKPIHCYCGSSSGSIWALFYDKDKNVIETPDVGLDQSFHYENAVVVKNQVFTPPSNCRYIAFYFDVSYGTYKNDTTFSIYYSPEEGGEGYDAYYPYVAPIRIDTGNETLKAFDKKLPSGVIERNTKNGTISGDSVTTSGISYTNVVYYAVPKPTNMKSYGEFGKCLIKNTKGFDYIQSSSMGGTWDSASAIGKYATAANGYSVWFGFALGTTLEQAKAQLGGMEIQYEAKTPTTEQGTPFSEYAPINDYSYMAWFDTDGNLVNIPQGCKLFYPVDYKGFADDLVMYTNGDATSLAKLEDLTGEATNRASTDTILQSAIGGTLRQCLCVKESLDFENTGVVDLKDLSFTRSKNGDIYCFMSSISDKALGSSKMLSTIYKVVSVAGFSILANQRIGVKTNDESTTIGIRDDSCETTTAFKAKVKGQLIAYEKAST